MHDWTIQGYEMAVERMVVTDKLSSRTIYAHEIRSSCNRWIRLGKWRSYNTYDSFPAIRTTALGNVRMAEHKHFYNGFRDNIFVWRMK